MSGPEKMQQIPPDPRDELLEIALRETLGGESPPDLRERVLAALANDAAGAATKHAPKHITINSDNLRAVPQHRRAFQSGYFGGLAAAAVITTIYLLFNMTHPSADAPAWLRTGVIEHQNGGSSVTRVAPDSSPILVATGDLLRCSPANQAVLFISDLGTLWVHENSILEVKNMEWKDFGKGAVLGSLTVGVIAGSIHWFSGTTTAQASSGDNIKLTKSDGNGGEAVAKLIEELKATKDRLRELEAAAAENRRKPARPEAGGTDSAHNNSQLATASAPADKSANGSLQFNRKGLEEVLAKVDWNVMGVESKKLAAKLAELADKLAKGEQPSLELIGEIQAINGLLVQQTGILMKGGIPGTYPNSTFTHPLVVANQLAALFKNSGCELTPEQSKALDALAQKYTDEDDFRRARMPEDSSKLQQFLDEMGLRSRFYKEAWQTLSPEQLAQMNFPSTKGLGNFDIFGPGVAWGPITRTIPVDSRESASAGFIKTLTEGTSMNDAQSAEVQSIVNKWMAKYPDSYWTGTQSPLAQQRVMPVEQMEIAAKLQLEMYKDMLNSNQLTPDQKAAILKNPFIYIPYVSGKK